MGVGVLPVAAQEMECTPAAVGEDTGVFFLVLGGSCTREVAQDYHVVADLVRDDDASELLVLIDAPHDDAETQAAAQILVEAIQQGGVDDHLWRPASPPEQPMTTPEQPMNLPEQPER